MKEIRYRSPVWSDPNGYRCYTVIYSDDSRATVMEHREVMEKAIGRRLDKNECVHHKDGNRKNNELSNLEVQGRLEHSKNHGKDKIVPPLDLVCRECGKKFTRVARYERYNRKMRKVGSFCGRSCSAKWSRRRYHWVSVKKKTEYEHGTNSAYDYRRCRCLLCTEAHRIRLKKWRTARAGTQTGKAARFRGV